MIKDAELTTRGALPAIMLMAFVSGAIVGSHRTSAELDRHVDTADGLCDVIHARAHDHVTCMPIRGDSQIFVVTVRDHHLVAAIYDNAGHQVVASTTLDVMRSSCNTSWQVLEPGLAVRAVRDHKLVSIQMHDGDSSRSVLKLHWLDLGELDR